MLRLLCFAEFIKVVLLSYSTYITLQRLCVFVCVLLNLNMVSFFWRNTLGWFICSSMTKSLPVTFFNWVTVKHLLINFSGVGAWFCTIAAHVDRVGWRRAAFWWACTDIAAFECWCHTGPEVFATPTQTSLPSLTSTLCVFDLSLCHLKHLGKPHEEVRG